MMDDVEVFRWCVEVRQHGWYDDPAKVAEFVAFAREHKPWFLNTAASQPWLDHHLPLADVAVAVAGTAKARKVRKAKRGRDGR